MQTVITISGSDVASAWELFPDVASIFASLLHTGTASLALGAAATHTANTAHYAAVYAAPTSTVTISALFETRALADAAVALEGAGFIAALSAELSINASLVRAPPRPLSPPNSLSTTPRRKKGETGRESARGRGRERAKTRTHT